MTFLVYLYANIDVSLLDIRDVVLSRVINASCLLLAEFLWTLEC